MYSTTLGRFLQPDPTGYAGGLNLYAYAGNDPLNLSHPLGLAPDSPQSGTAADSGQSQDFHAQVMTAMNQATSEACGGFSPSACASAIASYHEYDTSLTNICLYSDSSCTMSNATNSMMATQVPGYNGVTVNNGIYPFTIPVAGYIGNVQVITQGNSATNITQNNHFLYIGYVNRNLTSQSDGIYISTHGEGYNYGGPAVAFGNQLGGQFFLRDKIPVLRVTINLTMGRVLLHTEIKKELFMFRSALSSTFIGLLLIIASCLFTNACADTTREPYLPLDGAIIIVTGDQKIEPFINVIIQFCNEHNLVISKSFFPKSGRTVAKINIKVGDDSFIDVNNFLNQDQFVLNAYSHEDVKIWKGAWDQLIEKLAYAFGRENIYVRVGG